MVHDPKSYKAEEDPERAFYLISFGNVAKDYPATQALAASFMRELAAMNLRQVERDAKAAKAAAESASEGEKKSEPEDEPSSSRAFASAPSVPRR